MTFREAQLSDIKQLYEVRLSVKENVLPDPGFITEREYEKYLTHFGKGWLCEIDGQVAGFAIIGLSQRNVWALFVRPEHEGKGIGRKLHDIMLEWYFNQTNETVWLGTGPNTRAEIFYRAAGWKETAKRPNGELKFELSSEDWKLHSKNKTENANNIEG
ncbi:MAG TPA: GNAT family N-acetyltransferase [Chitinophagaceae bacterium]